MGSVIYHDHFANGTVVATTGDAGTKVAATRTALVGYTRLTALIGAATRDNLLQFLRLGSTGTGYNHQSFYPTDSAGNAIYTDFSATGALPFVVSTRMVIYDAMPNFQMGILPQVGGYYPSSYYSMPDPTHYYDSGSYVDGDGQYDASSLLTGWEAIPSSDSLYGRVAVYRTVTAAPDFRGGGYAAVKMLSSFNAVAYAPQDSYWDGQSLDISFVVRNKCTGTVNVTGTAVKWLSGDMFSAEFAPSNIVINGTTYAVSAFNHSMSLTLSSGPGSPITGGTYTSDVFDCEVWQRSTPGGNENTIDWFMTDSFRALFPYLPNLSGTVTTSGTAVTLSTGSNFVNPMAAITIAGSNYGVQTVNSTSSLTLFTSAGTHASPVAYTAGRLGFCPVWDFLCNRTNITTSNIGIYETVCSSGLVGTNYDPLFQSRHKYLGRNISRSGLSVARDTNQMAGCLHDSYGGQTRDTVVNNEQLTEVAADGRVSLRRTIDSGATWSQLSYAMDSMDIYGGSPTNDVLPGITLKKTGGTVTLSTDPSTGVRSLILTTIGAIPLVWNSGGIYQIGASIQTQLSDLITAINGVSGWTATLDGDGLMPASWLVPPTAQTPVSIDVVGLPADGAGVSLVQPKIICGSSFGTDGAGLNCMLAAQRYPDNKWPHNNNVNIEVAISHSTDGGSTWVKPYQALASGSFKGSPWFMSEDMAPFQVYYGPNSKYWFVVCYTGSDLYTIILRSKTQGTMPTTAGGWDTLLCNVGAVIIEPYIVECSDAAQTLLMFLRSGSFAYYCYSTDHGTTWSTPTVLNGAYSGGAQIVSPVFSDGGPVMAVCVQGYVYVLGQPENKQWNRSRMTIYRSTNTINSGNAGSLLLQPFGGNLFGGGTYGTDWSSYPFPYYDGSLGLYIGYSRNGWRFFRDPNFFGQSILSGVGVAQTGMNGGING